VHYSTAQYSTVQYSTVLLLRLWGWWKSAVSGVRCVESLSLLTSAGRERRASNTKYSNSTINWEHWQLTTTLGKTLLRLLAVREAGEEVTLLCSQLIIIISWKLHVPFTQYSNILIFFVIYIFNKICLNLKN